MPVLILAAVSHAVGVAADPHEGDISGRWMAFCPSVWPEPRPYELTDVGNGEVEVEAGPHRPTNLFHLNGTLVWNEERTKASGSTTLFLTDDPMSRHQGRIAPLELKVVDHDTLLGKHTFFMWDPIGKEVVRVVKTAKWHRVK